MTAQADSLPSEVPAVLIVEDDPQIATPLRVLFARRGHPVRMARTLEQAKHQLDADVRWVILDLNLPDGPGEELIDYARHQALEPMITVVTGISDRARLDSMLARKPHAALRKPVEFEDLLVALGLKRV